MSSSHDHAHAPSSHFDEHGHKDHGHVIVSIFTLRFVLGALLFLTLATVAAARIETWIAEAFHVEIPTAVNVFVALSIAAVKTILVVLFFMQLKYDNPLNSMILIFTLMAVACFLGFTALDLGNRKSIDFYKGHYIVDGGSGGTAAWLKTSPEFAESIPTTIPLTEQARRRHLLAGDSSQAHGHGGHGPGDHESKFSTASRSRPVTGLTLGDLVPEDEVAPTDDGGHSPAGQTEHH